MDSFIQEAISASEKYKENTLQDSTSSQDAQKSWQAVDDPHKATNAPEDLQESQDEQKPIIPHQDSRSPSDSANASLTQAPSADETSQEFASAQEHSVTQSVPKTTTQATQTDSSIVMSNSSSSSGMQNIIDDELEELLAHQQANIKIIGCGGGGCNTINRISEVGIVGAQTIAVNTDAQDLLYTGADKKILIGRDLTKGLGAGGKPQVGAQSAKENEKQIRESLQDSKMVFITCGMGGGTGTGSASVIADIAKKSGALTIAIVTTPFKMEGGRRQENAELGLDTLAKSADTLIIIPNDKLLSIANQLPIKTAFKVADEILTNAVKGIAELVTKPGLVNLDFADITTVMGDGGIALIGVGESDSDDRAQEAVNRAIANPLLYVEISGAKGALINVSGGLDLTLEEAKTIVQTITQNLDPLAKIIWGAQINEDLDGTVQVMLVVTGVTSSLLSEKSLPNSSRDYENDLGIEFV
ncbi:MAG: cell division protein FtsZ [Candidatus Nanoarchaeia archaeon]